MAPVRCGCWFTGQLYPAYRQYMPLVKLQAHTLILGTASRTTLSQTFNNTSGSPQQDVSYSFPLHAGVAVVSFTACVDGVRIVGVVKETQQARAEYRQAVDQGKKAALLEQQPAASDVFTARIGNVPPDREVVVEVHYISELKQDAEAGGIRLTIPVTVAPRYGDPGVSRLSGPYSLKQEGMSFTIDVDGGEGAHIQEVSSPSHHISVLIGRTSKMATAAGHAPHRASASLTVSTMELDKDVVVIIKVRDSDVPRALLETHPTMPNQRALMATLVPRFKLPPCLGEIVFLVDRSGSMGGKMAVLRTALTLLLKSLPVGVMFNICSFGSRSSFMWPRSVGYDAANLGTAVAQVAGFRANFGGTEILPAVETTVANRYRDMDLDVLLLTDGEVWDQPALFRSVEKAAREQRCRFFTLGIGRSVSTSLVEGVAAAGNGFSQFVTDGEKMDRKAVALLRGALAPRLKDCRLEVRYRADEGDQDSDGFEFIDARPAAITLPIRGGTNPQQDDKAPAEPLSFFDPAAAANMDLDMPGNASSTTPTTTTTTPADRYAHLPAIPAPAIIQAPAKIHSLFAHARTTVYLLLGPATHRQVPDAVVLRAAAVAAADGGGRELELVIPVQDVGVGQTIHQLAAKRAVGELEAGRGWLAEATDSSSRADGDSNGEGKPLLRDQYDGRWAELLEREAVSLGVKYGVAGKWCSFVAVEEGKEDEEVQPRRIPAVRALPLAAPPPPLLAAPEKASVASINAVFERMQEQEREQREQREQQWQQQQEQWEQEQEKWERQQPEPPRRRIVRRTSAAFSYGRKAKRDGGEEDSGYSYGRKTKRDGGKEDLNDKPVLWTNQPAPALGTDRPVLRNDEERTRMLIQLQRFDGSWEWNDTLLHAIGIADGSSLSRLLDGDAAVASATLAARATALAIAFLRVNMPAEAEALGLVVEKAGGWLRSQEKVDVDGLVGRMEEIVRDEEVVTGKKVVRDGGVEEFRVGR